MVVAAWVVAALSAVVGAEGVERPVSLAQGDLDGDGHQDLVVGSATEGGGRLTVYVRFAEWRLSRWSTIATSEPPAYLFAADLDGDGPAELLAADRGGRAVHLFRWEQDGEIRSIGGLEVPGPITAMAVGELGPRDGSTEIAAAVAGPEGPRMLVLGGGGGKLPGLRVSIPLPETASALRMGRFDADAMFDLLIETSRGVFLLGGAAPASIEPVDPVVGAEPERAVGLPGRSIAVLTSRLNRDALADQVVLLDGSMEPLTLESTTSNTFTVTHTGDAGPGSLRQAILDANGAPGADAIHFDIAGAGPHTIVPTSALPVIVEAVTIDGTTEPSFAGRPVVEIDGSLTSSSSGLEITAGTSVVRGLAIHRFSTGIFLRGAGGNVVEGNHVGTDASGTLDRGNAVHGILVSSNGNTIGGTTSETRNVVSGNDNFGIAFGAGTTGNVAQGNFVGTDATGTVALPNGLGISTEGQSAGPTSVTIGGTAPGAQNVVSGNAGSGISLGGTTAGHVVQANLIGTDSTGTIGLGNGGTGVSIQFGSCCNMIGGITAAAGNVISANGAHGIRSDYHPLAVKGNLIGLGRDGSPLGNAGHGVFVNLFTNQTIGGDEEGAGNTISFNAGDGISLAGSASANAVSRNAVSSNGGLGIDLGADGVTPNDPQDADAGLQNFPQITAAANTGASTRIDGVLESEPGTTYRVQFFASPACDPSGNGEGARFAGSTTTTTDGTGTAVFSATLDLAVDAGQVVTATAIHTSQGTSELSSCHTVVCTATAPAGTTDLRVERDRIEWSLVPSASAYDVVRGSVTALRSTGGDFATSTSGCVGDDVPSNTLADSEEPPSGDGSWLLVRAVNCAGPGTYDGAGASQSGPRDEEIERSGLGCP